jgi:hypothetical protein
MSPEIKTLSGYVSAVYLFVCASAARWIVYAANGVAAPAAGNKRLHLIYRREIRICTFYERRKGSGKWKFYRVPRELFGFMSVLFRLCTHR